MEAVKKAYAEIILNMAKEAAARVMVSEKKALKFQQDLQSKKEEALQMLLRLKLMIDTKTTEAEILSQNQQRRIDELEAQLNEAEGLIIDLRAELHDVHAQLHEERNKPPHHLRLHAKEDFVCCNSIMAKSNLNHSESLKFPTELGSEKSADKSDIALCNYSKDNPNESEIYQSGWCAIEMSLADERLHSGDDQSFPNQVTQVTEPSGRDAEAHIVPSSKTKKVENSVGEEPLKGHASMQRPYTFRGKRRRKARYGKTKNSSCKARCNKLVLSQRPLPAISHCSARYLKTSTLYDSPNSPSPNTNTERKNVAGSFFVLGKEEPQNKGLNVAVARRSIRKRRVKYLDDSCPASLLHSSHPNQPTRPGQQCPSFPTSKSNAVECTVRSTKLEGGMKEGSGVQTTYSGFTAENKICRKFTCAYNDAHEDKELIDVSVMVEEGDGESLLNFGMLPVESIFGDAKASEVSKESNLQGNNMTSLKYTFSRKRKKDNLLTPNENSSPECSVKKRSVETENIDPRLQDLKALKDSPLRSRQLVQVAHQLISLSGRSWWQ